MRPEDLLTLVADAQTRHGVSKKSLDDLEQIIGRSLPVSYRELMQSSNGFEGFDRSDDYLVFWPAEQLAELNTEYGVPDSAPGLFLFGSNGGDAGYAFDTRHDPMQIREVPFIGMSIEDSVLVGTDFDEFLSNR